MAKTFNKTWNDITHTISKYKILINRRKNINPKEKYLEKELKIMFTIMWQIIHIMAKYEIFNDDNLLNDNL